MPPMSPEDILQAVYDATEQAIRTTVELVLNEQVVIDAVRIADGASPLKMKVKADGIGENAAVVTQNEQPLPEGAATEAKQDALLGVDFGTETTLAAVLAKLISNPATSLKQDQLLARDFSTEATLAAILAKLISAPSTEAKQDQLLSKDFATEATLAAILAKLIANPSTEAKQDALLAKDFSTEATLNAVLAKLSADPATAANQTALLAKDFSTETTLAAILAKLISAPATEAKQDALIAKDFSTETTLAAILNKLVPAPATEAKQDALIAKDYSTEATLSAILAKLIAAPSTEAKQDNLIALFGGGGRQHRELTSVSTSYNVATNSMSFSTLMKHISIYSNESIFWVDSASSDTDAGTKLTTPDQRGFVEKGGRRTFHLVTGITRMDFLAAQNATAVYVTGMA